MNTQTVYARIKPETRAALDAYCNRTGSTLANAVDQLLATMLGVKPGPAEFFGPPVIGQVCALCAAWLSRMPGPYVHTVIHHQTITNATQLAEAAGRGLLLRGQDGTEFDPRPIAVINGTAVCGLHIADAYDMVFLRQRRI